MTLKFALKGLTLACIVCTANVLFAQSATAPDTSKPKEVPLSIAGHVDAYYRYSSNGVAGKTSYSDAGNGFGFGMANLQISKDNGKVGFMADVMFGPRAEATNYNYYDAVTGKSSSLALIKQLYVTYKATDKAKFTIGNFMTYVGYELAEASNNLNYSMSYNYTNGPFFHTGIKLDYQITDKFGGMIGVFNRTDTKLDNGPKFIGGQLSYVDGPFKIYLNGLSGKETDSLSVTTLDVTTSYQATSKLGIGFNLINKSYARTKEANTSWLGTAFYVNYAFTDKFLMAARGEYMSDTDGLLFGVLKNNLTAFTLSANFKVDALTIIPEIRFDSSPNNVFSTTSVDAKGVPIVKGSETAFILAAVYKF